MTSAYAAEWLMGSDLSWRWILQILLLSAGLTAASQIAFVQDPRSRRTLGVLAVQLLIVVPLVCLIWQPRWQIGLSNPPQLPQLANVPALLLLGWVLLMGVGVVRLGRQVLRVKRDLAALPECGQQNIVALTEELSTALGMQPPRLRIGGLCCASSLSSPTIVVPAEFQQWDPAAQRAVLAHELVHLRRADDRWMLALQLVWRCYLFCPWLALLYARFVQAIEESCDDCAAQLLGDRTAYLAGLADAAVAEQASRPVSTTLTYMARNSLLDRVQRLLQGTRFHEVQSGVLTSGVTCGLLLLLLGTTFQIVPAQRNFSDELVRLPPSAPSSQAAALGAGFIPEIEVVSLGLQPTAQRNGMVIYPGEALLEELEGRVLIGYHIAADGSVTRARVLESTPANIFDKAAIRAVKQTLYTVNDATGQPGARAEAQRLFLFRLRNE